jgi:photosystem II stability/assembly factor-like uncharacterized protein
MSRIVSLPVSMGPGILLAMLLPVMISGAWAQTPAEVPEEEYSVILPLADRALLFDATTVDGRTVAVGDHGIVLVSEDGGASWRQSRVPTRSMLTGVWFHDSDLGWAVGHDSAILKTIDGGATWRLVHFQPDLLLPFFDVWFSDASNGIAVGAYGFVMSTNDGGETWAESSLDAQELVAEEEDEEPAREEGYEPEDDPFWEDDFSGGADFHLNKITRADDGGIFIVAEGGYVYRSKDDGATWFTLPSVYTGSFFSSLPLANGDVLVFGLRGNIFRSSDGGLTWRQLDSPVSITLNEGVELADGTIVIVGMSGTILVSRDGGDNFKLVQRPDRKALTKVLARADNGLLVFGEGGIVRLDSGEF